MSAYSFTPIGVVHSPFKEKFGIPRQPGLATEARASLEIVPPFDRDEAFQGLEAFSHLWIIFLFHATAGRWRPTVRPPRLGGNQRVGVFATRSTFRPNPIGLSVVSLEGVERSGGRLQLLLRGADLLEGTPVLDIKPYLPYADSVAAARAGFAAQAPQPHLAVVFSARAEAQVAAREAEYVGLRRLIEQLLGADPRPAYRDDDGRVYGMRLYDFDLRWRVEAGRAQVIALEPVGEG